MKTKQEIRGLFSATDFTAQSTRLLGAFGQIVQHLHETDMLIELLEDLGQRHVYYNVKPKHFKVFKVCWMAVVEEALGFHCQQPQREAWNKAYDFMASVMKQSLKAALAIYR